MISIRTSTKIDRPIDMVSNYIFDMKNSKKWYRNIIYADLLVNTPLRQGTNLFIKKNFLGTEILSKCKVLECEKGRKLKLKVESLIKIETTFFLECVGNSQTRIIIRNKSKLNTLLIPFIPFSKIILKINSRNNLSNLKTILEQKKEIY